MFLLTAGHPRKVVADIRRWYWKLYTNVIAVGEQDFVDDFPLDD